MSGGHPSYLLKVAANGLLAYEPESKWHSKSTGTMGL